MNKMNGNIATRKVNFNNKIKDLIWQKNYIDCQIVGYSSDYDVAINEAFL